MPNIVTMRAADLILDRDIYPRSSGPDPVHVRNIVYALQCGTKTPPLLADETTLRIVDGAHRQAAHLKVFGDDAQVEVELRRYESEDALYAASVKANTTDRALPLQEHDKRRAAQRLGISGLADDEIAVILRIPQRVITEIRYEYATVVRDNGEPLRMEALKRPLSHFQGKSMTEAQAAAQRSAPGTTYLMPISQLRKALEFDLLDNNNPKLMTALADLSAEITTYLSDHPQEGGQAAS